MSAHLCAFCKTPSIITVNAKCDDRCSVLYNDIEHTQSIPPGLGIGEENYIRFSYCHICMKIQQEPIPLSDIQDIF